MRRTRVALVTMVAAALTVLALPAQAATDVVAYRSQGPYANAFSSTAPADTAPTPGVVYEDVAVGGNQSATTDTGGVMLPFAYVDVQRYTFTNDGERVDVSYTTGAQQGGDVSFTWAKDLASASLTATVTVKTCTPAGCTPGSATISLAWSATGPVVRSVDNSRTLVAGQFVYISHDRGSYRDATASGTVLGTAFTSTVYAAIGTDNYSERLITDQQ